MIPWSAAADSGPSTIRRTCSAGTASRTADGALPVRAAATSRTGASASRRRANASTAVDAGSSHCRSSIATTTSCSVARIADERAKRGRDEALRRRLGRLDVEEGHVERVPLRRR